MKRQLHVKHPIRAIKYPTGTHRTTREVQEMNLPKEEDGPRVEGAPGSYR